MEASFMTHRFIGVLAAFALAIPVLIDAQATPVKHPDFTGTWRVINVELPQRPADGDNGPAPGGFGGVGGRGGYGGRGGGRRGGGGYGGGNRGGNGGVDNGNASDARGGMPTRLQVGQTLR